MNRFLCGRTASAAPGSDDASTILGRMSRQLAPHSGSTAIEVARTSGVAVSDGDRGRFIVKDGSLLGAFTGDPYWSCSELRDLGRRTSFEHSLAQAYSRHGIELLDRLHGPFSLALIATETNEALVATDRMGINPVYFAHTPDAGFFFASKAASIFAHGGLTRQIRHQAIFDYLYFHMIPGPGTVFENCFKLNPGECVVFRDGSLTRKRYWSADFEADGTTGFRTLEEELKSTLRNSVKRCLSDGTDGCFLSGGIDSSTIAGLVSEIEPPARTFTIGFQEEGYDETRFARISAKHFNTTQTEYFVSPADVVDIVPRIASEYDEPFGNSSVVPAYYCARLARQNGITRLLAGDGGDELFGGNARYVTQQVFALYGRLPRPLRSAVIEPLVFELPGADRFPPARKMQSYIRQARVTMPDRLETYNHLSRIPVTDILQPGFLDSVDTNGPIAMLRERYESSRSPDMLNRMLELDWKFTLADNDLRKVNRMCEMADVEVRYPFLDDELVEFSARVPPGLKIRYWRLRYFFKRAMQGFLPEEVLRKQKHGFGLPFGLWMKSFAPLRELAYDSLSQLGQRGIVRREYLDRLILDHRSGHAHYYGEFIWVLMMLELWLQANDVRLNPGPGT